MSEICWQSFGSGHTTRGWHQLNASHRITSVGNRTEGIGKLRTRTSAAERLLHGERLWESIPLDKTIILSQHVTNSTAIFLRCGYIISLSCNHVRSCHRISRLVIMVTRHSSSLVIVTSIIFCHGGRGSASFGELQLQATAARQAARRRTWAEAVQAVQTKAAFCSNAFSNISDDAWGSR